MFAFFFVAVDCCGWLLLFVVAGFCCFIFMIRQNKIFNGVTKYICNTVMSGQEALFLYIDRLIYLQSLLLCQTDILLALILTLCFRSSPLLPIQTASLATLPSLTARPVSILSQNVMPVFITSVITSTPLKTNNTSQIKKSPHQILVTTMGYIHKNYSFSTGRIEPFNIQYSDDEHNLMKYLPSNIEICHTHKKGIISWIFFL